MRTQSVWLLMAILVAVCPAQQPHSKSSTRRLPPSLGFNRIKDVSPVVDTDALREESELKKKLPDNQFVGDKRAFHEAALMHEFLDGFRNSKECEGITFYLRNEKVPDFVVQITVNNHDTPDSEQEWIWILSDTKKKELGGLGNQSSAELTARDVCMTVWEDVDANHFKKPGGKIE
jgi:hypothetical protein